MAPTGTHLEQTGAPDAEAMRATGRILKMYREWLAGSGGQAAALWMRENGQGKGSHVHILLHVPEGATLAKRTRRWVALATGRRYRPGVVKTRSLPRGEAYRVNLGNVLAYMLKGGSAEAGALLGLPRLVPGHGQALRRNSEHRG